MSDVNLKGYSYFNCYRPKFNKRAKRYSGGVLVYFRDELKHNLSIVKKDNRGIIWLKLDKCAFNVNNDIYLCLCYIPPENSSVYKNGQSDLYECDLFDIINDDVLLFQDRGDIFLCGDLNARVGENDDCLENTGLDRFIDLPDSVQRVLPKRLTDDKTVNAFGNNLLNLCKNNKLHNVNGRLEPGRFTCYTSNRISTGCSIVDYVITNSHNFDLISHFCNEDLNEFSDHCPISFNLDCCINISNERNVTENVCIEKIIWDRENICVFNDCLAKCKHVFESIVDDFESDVISTDECIDSMSELMLRVCKESFNSIKIKRVNNADRNNQTSEWFDDRCKQAKNVFYKSKRIYKADPNPDNRRLFLESRNCYKNIKRSSKYKYDMKRRSDINTLSKDSPKKF